LHIFAQILRKPQIVGLVAFFVFFCKICVFVGFGCFFCLRSAIALKCLRIVKSEVLVQFVTIGEPWRTVENRGEPWRTVENRGEPWRTTLAHFFDNFHDLFIFAGFQIF